MDGHVPETGGRSSSAQLAESIPKKRGARVGLFIVLAVGVAFAGVLGVRVKQAVAKRDAVANERAATAEKQKIRVPLRTVHGTPMRWMPRVDLTGTLKPWREADVGFETQGRLVKIGVATGDVVAEGQVLAFLDASRAAAQVGQAESQVKAAQASLAL